MARKIMSSLASCHKLLPAAILLALLISSHSQTSFAELSGSASASANGATGSSGAGAQISGSIGGVGGSLSIGSSASSSGSGGSSASAGGSASSGSSGSQAQVSASVTQKPEGLLSKLKDVVKNSVGLSSDKRENSMQISGNASSGGSSTLGSGPIMSASGSASASGSSSGGSSLSAQASGEVKSSSEGIMDKLGDAAKRGKELIKEKVQDVKDLVNSEGSSSSGSGGSGGSGSGGGSASASGNVKIGSSILNANVQVGVDSKKGDGMMSKFAHKVEDKASEMGKDIKSNLKNVQENKSVAVQVLDKFAEVAKKPVESVLKPIDKALGIQNDPMLKMYEDSHEMLRKPLGVVAKPVEKVLSGAFKTSDEARKESRKYMSAKELQELKKADDRLKKEGRSILGEISDKTVELYEKPIEIVLKPVDHALGFDKDGKKNPLIRLINEIYGFSKKPLDSIAKPFENILKKMAEGDQAYQVSVRFNADSNDPKLFTRLADGALNIADRVITKPIDYAMRPLGFGDNKKSKNPIVDATHKLKNATRLGIELFTKPLDRIIKEIAEIGAIKDDAHREAEIQRKRLEASRIVRALDKFHQFAQTPWEIVLRPIGKTLGYNKEGRREPLLRAWDVFYQIFRTPIQVIGKPFEDAILGEQSPRPLTPFDKAAVHSEANLGGPKKNIFVDGIKKVEKLAAKPFEIITSPIRRLILGEDSKSQAKAQAQVGVNAGKFQAKIQAGAKSGGNQPDKIVKTIEQMNNLILKPFEVITQPISDIVSSDKKSSSSSAKVEVKAQGQVGSQQKGQQQLSASAQAQVKG